MTLSYNDKTHNDQWILDLYQNNKNGFYVEAGALDGIAGSCTYLLETTLGWTGILVEPGTPYNALINNRSNNTCLNLCLSGKNGPVVFADSTEPGYSGIIDSLEALDQRYQQLNWKPRIEWKEKGFTKKTIESVTLFDLLNIYRAPRIIDYLALDIEGSEYDVLKEFPFDHYLIMAISIEGDQCHNLLLSKGYQPVKNPFNIDAPWEHYYLHPDFYDHLTRNFFSNPGVIPEPRHKTNHQGEVGIQSRTSQVLYEIPREVKDISQCYFYHTMDVPGHGTIEGVWDLRPGFKDYYGNVNFKDKRVLEIGSAAGFGCFTMEQLGAEVVAYDLSPEYSWDLVPWHDQDCSVRRSEFKKWVVLQNNGFWFNHRAFQSQVKMVYGSVYSIPEEIGKFDISTLCSVLLHLRDPFLAIQNTAALTRETIIVTDLMFKEPDQIPNQSTVYFRPPHQYHDDSNFTTWWFLPPETIVHFLHILGFEDTYISRSNHLWRKAPHGDYTRLPFYTVVGKRKPAEGQ